jgi:hypothetical protein
MSRVSSEVKSEAVLLRLPPSLAQIVRAKATDSGVKKPEAIRRIIEMWAELVKSA